MTDTPDLVVVLPGIMGSTLSAEGQLIWAPSSGAVLRAIGTFGRSMSRCTLPDNLGDEHPGDGVEPVALMPDLHALPGLWTPVKGYDKLLAHLERLGYHRIGHRPEQTPHSAANGRGWLLPVPYDWRLSNRYNAVRLATIIEPVLDRLRATAPSAAEARVVFVCHSMGGLIVRWYIEHCGGAEITRKLITLGTPYRGSIKALEQLVNGMPSGLGRFGDNLTVFARTLPSLYQLLPEYACLEHDGALLKTTETPLPVLRTAAVADAMAFHSALNHAEAARPASLTTTHAILGMNQPTPTTAQLTGGRIHSLDTYQERNLHGDGTVPAVAAARPDVPLDSNTLRRIADKHGNLQRNRAALDEITGILTNTPTAIRADRDAPAVNAPELILAGQDLSVTADLPDHDRRALRITVTDEHDRLIDSRTTNPARNQTRAVFQELRPGGYTITVSGLTTPTDITPVRSTVIVWKDPDTA